MVVGGSKAEDKHLQLVHTKDHVSLVQSLSTKKKDYRRNRIASQWNSIYLNGSSSEAAYLAAGSVVKVIYYLHYFTLEKTVRMILIYIILLQLKTVGGESCRRRVRLWLCYCQASRAPC